MPLLEGPVHVSETEPLPRVPATDVGAPGTVAGITADDADDAALVPTLFVAVTVNVYDVPFVKPETVQAAVIGLPVFDVHVKPPGDDVAV